MQFTSQVENESDSPMWASESNKYVISLQILLNRNIFCKFKRSFIFANQTLIQSRDSVITVTVNPL